MNRVPPAPGPALLDTASVNIVFTLWALKWADGRSASLAVPPGTDNVVFDIRVEADGLVRCGMSMTNLTNRRVVWRTSRVTLRSVGPYTSAASVMSAELLSSGLYSLELVGRKQHGRVERVITGMFEVLARESGSEQESSIGLRPSVGPQHPDRFDLSRALSG